MSHLVWNLNPQVLNFSPLPRWYGIIFAAGIVGGFLLVKNIFHREEKNVQSVDQLLLYVFFSMLIGMRLGHCLFYEPNVYLRDPLRILKIWEGGYASHGGFASLILGLALFAHNTKTPIWWLLDRMTMPSIFAAAMIRIGNFFNSEMIGRPSDAPWAIVFSLVDNIPRHPAQLYEALGFFAVFALAMTLYLRTKVCNRPGLLFGIIMICGFTWRLIVEFFKEDQVAFEAGLALNMGQLLSLPFIAVGLTMVFQSYRRTKTWY